MDAILIPRECVTDPKLRCSPELVLIRLPRLETVSLQDHFPPPNIDEEANTQVFNSLPEYTEISSEYSDAVVLE